MENNKLPIIRNINDKLLAIDLKSYAAKAISMMTLTESQYYAMIKIMFIVGLFVFIALFFIQAGYGKFQKSSVIWSVLLLPNQIAWILMECPVFIEMMLYLFNALFHLDPSVERRQVTIETLFCFSLFQLHYFQRSFVFIVVMLAGAAFNTRNGILQGNWLFNISSDDYYDNLFKQKSFYLGVIFFFTGMFINIHSDHVIRTLRKRGDTNHYLPQRGMYRFVTSANYLGEIIEWTGYAILTQSLCGVLFVYWTIANLVPRSFSIYNLYLNEFGSDVLKKKRIIPFIM